jgi:hypothetical protein
VGVGSGTAVVEVGGGVVVGGTEVVGEVVGVEVGVGVGSGSPQLITVIATSRITKSMSNFLNSSSSSRCFVYLKGFSVRLRQVDPETVTGVV